MDNDTLFPIDYINKLIELNEVKHNEKRYDNLFFTVYFFTGAVFCQNNKFDISDSGRVRDQPISVPTTIGDVMVFQKVMQIIILLLQC